MTKKLSKAVIDKSRIRNKYLKRPPREKFLAQKKVKNKCDPLNKKAKKSYFQKVTQKMVQ